MKILFGTSEDKKDIVRATNAVIGAQDLVNQPIILTGAWGYEKVDEKGEPVTVTALKVKQENGEEVFCSSISKTVADSIDTILEIYEDGEIQNGGVPIIIKSKKSKAGRDFYYIDLR